MKTTCPVTSNPRLNVPMTPEQWDVVDFLAFESETAVYYPFDTAFDDLTMDMIDSIVSQCERCTDDSNVIFEAATRILGIPTDFLNRREEE